MEIQPAREQAAVDGPQAWHEADRPGRRRLLYVGAYLFAVAVVIGFAYLRLPYPAPAVSSLQSSTDDQASAAAASADTASDPGRVAPAEAGESSPVRTAEPAPPPLLTDAAVPMTRPETRSATGVSAGADSSSGPTPPVIAGRAQPRVGVLEVASEPSGLRVFVDGRPAGITPLTIRAITPTRHDVLVSQGTTVVNRSVNVTAGATSNLFVSLTDPESAADAGSLEVHSPLPLRILEDGRTIGVSTSAPVTISAGRHQFELVNDEIELHVPLTVEIAAGKPTRLSVPLPTGTLSLEASPWAEVFVDGRRLGLTPIANAQVPVGRHDVAWRHPTLGEKRSIVVVGARTPARASMDFSR